MSAPTPNSISVTTKPTFWEVFVATLVLLRYRWPFNIYYVYFPMAGLFLLLMPIMIMTGDRHDGVDAILMVLFGLSCLPLGAAFSVWSARHRNKLAQGPYTYSFDAEGMHLSGAAFNSTILWTGIPRIRRSRRFLFIFISPARAYSIPLRAISDPRFFDDLRSIAGGHTDFGPSTGR